MQSSCIGLNMEEKGSQPNAGVHSGRASSEQESSVHSTAPGFEFPTTDHSVTLLSYDDRQAQSTSTSILPYEPVVDHVHPSRTS
jgi:hypothetical protein